MSFPRSGDLLISEEKAALKAHIGNYYFLWPNFTKLSSPFNNTQLNYFELTIRWLIDYWLINNEIYNPTFYKKFSAFLFIFKIIRCLLQICVTNQGFETETVVFLWSEFCYNRVWLYNQLLPFCQHSNIWSGLLDIDASNYIWKQPCLLCIKTCINFSYITMPFWPFCTLINQFITCSNTSMFNHLNCFSKSLIGI